MIERLATHIIGQMKDGKIINKEDEESYIYSFITLVEKIITVGTILLISVVVDRIIPTILFLGFFFALRKRSGGYHFNSFIKCYIGTTITYLLILYVDRMFIINLPLLYALMSVSIVIIGVIGTVNHPNLELDECELAESKRRTRYLVVLEGSIVYCFAALPVDNIYINYGAIAIIVCAILLCIAKIKKQEVGLSEGEKQQKSVASS